MPPVCSSCGMNSRLSDAELAARIAQGAGEVLLGIRSGDLLGGAMLGDVGDALAQAWISTVLRKHRPRDAVLSEEAADVGDRATASRVWIIDPLDGTREFAGGSSDWAVHVALTESGIVTEASVSTSIKLPGRSAGAPPPTGGTKISAALCAPRSSVTW